jgi:hypothetical protein
MGKLVVAEFVSVDGVFEDPGGSEGYEHGPWTGCRSSGVTHCRAVCAGEAPDLAATPV